MTDRKIIQIVGFTYQKMGSTSNCIIYALCDDGTLWFRSATDEKDNSWKQVMDFIPGTLK